MVKQKIPIYAILLLGVLLLSLTMVSAATTLNTPAASTTIGGALVTLNVSRDDADFVGINNGSLISIVFYAQSTLTANSSWVVIGRNNSINLSATTPVGEAINAFNSSILEDANNYIFNVTINNTVNGTEYGTDTNTGITVNETIPAAASSTTPADKSTDTDNSVDFNGTVTAGRTTSCTLLFDGTNPGSSSYAMTHTGSTCGVTLSNVPENSYNWYIRASDETDTTDGTITNVRVSVPTSASKVVSLLNQPGVISVDGAEITIAKQEPSQIEIPGILSTDILGIPIWIVALIFIVIAFTITKRKR